MLILLLHSISYTRCVYTDPGYIEQKLENIIPKNEIEQLGINYCEKCGNYKVPKAHHCSKCQKCVLRYKIPYFLYNFTLYIKFPYLPLFPLFFPYFPLFSLFSLIPLISLNPLISPISPPEWTTTVSGSATASG